MTGGKPHALNGQFFEPTIVTNATNEMLVTTDEPLVPLHRSSCSKTKMTSSNGNDTIFGLASYFYAKDISRVTKVAEALEYGIVGVNTGIISSEVAPSVGSSNPGWAAKVRTTGSKTILR